MAKTIDKNNYFEFTDEYGVLNGTDKDINIINTTDINNVSTVKAGKKGDTINSTLINNYGNAGDDTINVTRQNFNVFVDAGKGNDLIEIKKAKSAKIYAGAGNDTIFATSKNNFEFDYINAGAGRDIIYGRGGYDIINGGSGASLIVVGATGKENYTIEHSKGTDYIYQQKEVEIQYYYRSDNDLIFLYLTSKDKTDNTNSILTLKDYFKYGSKYSVKGMLSPFNNFDSMSEEFTKNSKIFKNLINNENNFLKIESILTNEIFHTSLSGEILAGTPYSSVGGPAKKITVTSAKTSSIGTDTGYLGVNEGVYIDVKKGEKSSVYLNNQSPSAKSYVNFKSAESSLYVYDSSEIDSNSLLKVDSSSARTLINANTDANIDINVSKSKHSEIVIGSNNSNVNVKGGNGAESVYINGGEDVLTDTNLGSGNDSFVATGLKRGSIVNSGAGNDLISVGASKARIYTGAGDDIIKIKDKSSLTQNNANELLVNSGTGNNIIYVTNKKDDSGSLTKGNITIESGGGKDYIYITDKFEDGCFSLQKREEDLIISGSKDEGTDYQSTITIKDYYKLGSKHSFKGFITDKKGFEVDSKNKITVKEYMSAEDYIRNHAGSGLNNRIVVTKDEGDYGRSLNGTDFNDYLDALKSPVGITAKMGKGKDTIVGSNYSDVFYLGEGEKIYTTTSGYDKIYLEKSDATIFLKKGNSTIYSGKPGAKLQITCDKNDLEYLRKGNDLVIRSEYAGGEITLANYYKLGKKFTIDKIKIWGSSSISISKDEIYEKSQTGIIENKKVTNGYGGAGNDTVTSSVQISAGAGDDVIYSTGQDDVIFAEKGDDTIYAGSGTTTFMLGNANNGTDIIHAQKSKIIIDGSSQGLVSDAFKYKKSGNDLILEYDGTYQQYDESKGSVVLKNFYKNKNQYTLKLKGGENINLKEDIDSYTIGVGPEGFVKNKYNAGGNNSYDVFGTNGNDTITSSSPLNSLFGAEGNDSIVGASGNGKFNIIYSNSYSGTGWVTRKDGNNTLKGGAYAENYIYSGGGNDKIYGGKNGVNTIHFAKGSGHDTVYSWGKATDDKYDILSFKNDYGANDNIDFSKLYAEIYGKDLILKERNNDNFSVTIKNYFNGKGSSVKYLQKGQQVSLTLLDDWLKNKSYFDNKTADLFKNNKIIGTKYDEIIAGGYFNDYIDGGDGDDTIKASFGNNTIYGGAGDDVIIAENGNGKIYGGIGNDSITIGNGNKKIDGGAGNDTITVTGNGNNTIKTGTGSDKIEIQGNGNNKIYLEGNGSSDINTVMIKGNGDNIITGGKQCNKINVSGGNGNNKIILGTTLGNDTISINSDGNNFVKASSGNDTISVMSFGSATIKAGKGNDRIDADFSDGNNYLYGENGNDSINGGNGNDYISGGNGNDTLDGRRGSNFLDGGNGDDVLKVTRNDSVNYLYGGAGDDQYIVDYVNQYTFINDAKGTNDKLIVGSEDAEIKYIVFDVKVDKKGNLVKSYGKDIYIVSRDDYDNIFDKNGTINFTDKNFTAKIEIKDQFGAGRIEYFCNKEKREDGSVITEEVKWEFIERTRQDIAGWLADKGYSSVSDAINAYRDGSLNDIGQLVYQDFNSLEIGGHGM